MANDNHDEVCDRRLGWIKTIIFSTLATVVLGGGYGYSQNEGMRSVNATQDQKIKHNEKALEKIDKKYDEHLREQRAVNTKILEKLGEMSEQMVRIELSVE